jgi:hypothetical protein
MRARTLLAVIGAVTAVPIVWWLIQIPRYNEPGDTIVTYGYIPKTPPVNFMKVGSIYYIDSELKHFYSICDADEADLKDLVHSSPSFEIKRSLERNGDLAAGVRFDIGRIIEGNGSASYVVKVNYSLNDLKIEEITLGSNWQIFGKLMAKRHCSTMASYYLSTGGYVCQVIGILWATTEFKLDRDAQNKLATSSTAARDEVNDIMKSAVESQTQQTVVDKEGQLVTGKALEYGAAVTPRCVAPANSWFQRVPAYTRLGRYWNYVLFNIVEPLLPTRGEHSEMQAPLDADQLKEVAGASY